MRILIDLQGCQSASRFGGIGRYSMSLAKAMLQLGTGHEICLLLNSRLPNENFIRAEFAGLMPQQNILTFDVPAYVAAENDLPAYTRMAELIREKRIAEINPDVLHIASLFEGAGEDVVTSVGMLFPASRTAVTLYDLIPYLEQKTYLTNQILSDHYLRKFEGLQRAGMLVSISEFSRAEALEHTDIAANRIVNISSAVDSQFAPLKIDPTVKNKLLSNAGIDKPFLMFTGSFDVRKNHERLVKAFANVPLAVRDQYQLVIIGKGETRQISRLKAIAKEHGLKEQDLVFVGHVTDTDLVAFYNLCALFVFPSLREGFGLPVLEAMSCGVPTIGSNRTSIPEVIARADALFDPEDIDDIAAKITAALSNKALREELSRHGLERAKNFSWALSAKRAIEVFERQHEGITKAPTELSSRSSTQSADHEVVYDEFITAFSTLKSKKLDDEFLASAAHVVAANELLGRIDSEVLHDELKIGWVTNWGIDFDGVTPSRRIIEALPKSPTIFAPYSKENIASDGPNVIRAWNSDERDDLSDLHQALSNAPIDVVVIQYDEGMFELSALAILIKKQKELDRHVFILFHATKSLAGLNSGAGALEIRVALKSCAAIFVHSMNDVKTLEAFKVRKNVSFLPRPEPQLQVNKSTGGDQAEIVAYYLMRKLAFAIARGDY